MNEVNVIADGALLISDGIIQEIGPTRRVEHLAAAKTALEIDATGKVVMPAFVDCFTRLLCGPPISESAEAAARAVHGYTTQRMELEARRRLRQFLRWGTTSLVAACGYGRDEQTEYKALRVLAALNDRPLWIVPWFYGASGCPPDYEGGAEAYLRWTGEQVLPELRRRKLAADVLAGDCFPPASIASYAECARALGMNVNFKSGSTITAESEITVLLPGESFHRAAPYPPARALIDSGNAVALATGYDHFDSPSVSMPMMMSFATKQMGMTPAEALTAATVNAAHAAGLGKWVGSFSCGKQADVLLLNAADYREIPHFFSMNLVALVIRAGQEIYPRMEAV